jgi:hypothetical protein
MKKQSAESAVMVESHRSDETAMSNRPVNKERWKSVRSLTPSFPALMCLVLGVFLVNAAFGVWIEGYVKERSSEQFIPIWTFFLGPLGAGPGVIQAMTAISKLLIGLVEFAAGGALILAAILRRRRMALTNLGCWLSLALFGLFCLVLFAMHDYDLPRWNQFPALFTWIGATWLVVAWADERSERG